MLDQLIARVGADRPIGSIDFDSVEVLIRTGGGLSIGDGLVRVHTAESAQLADGFVRDAFPDFDGRIQCFAFDWLGRQFSLGLGSGQGSRASGVLLFEPGTGEALEIPSGLEQFFNEEIVSYSEDALAESFFAAWRAAGGRAPAFSESIGYRQPLFLGGLDEVSNLELTDTEIYWGLFGQLRLRAIGLPVGSRIESVDVAEPPTGS